MIAKTVLRKPNVLGNVVDCEVCYCSVAQSKFMPISQHRANLMSGHELKLTRCIARRELALETACGAGLISKEDFHT